MDIPKKIHYCWFGNNRKNKLIEQCVRSWEQEMPDFEIIEWNEKNFDISQSKYSNDAYLHKKWAFVADYARLWILEKHGGIYLDTDVEVYKSLNQFRSHRFFSGFERYHEKLNPIVTAVIGATPNNELIQRLLSEYQNLDFIYPDGTPNTTSNTSIISEILLREYGINKEHDTHIEFANNMHIYPSNFFCIKSNDSFCSHHFSGSWLSPADRATTFIQDTPFLKKETKDRIEKSIKKFYKKSLKLKKLLTEK